MLVVLITWSCLRQKINNIRVGELRITFTLVASVEKIVWSESPDTVTFLLLSLCLHHHLHCVYEWGTMKNYTLLNIHFVSINTVVHILNDSKIKIIKYYYKDSICNDPKLVLGSHV